MINFASHQARAGEAGAREDFEKMLGQLVRTMWGDAHEILPNPGDWGIDVMVGSLRGRVTVWQAKYFFGREVGRSQQRQIKESFSSAIRASADHGYALERWVLCIPVSMDGPTTQWWQGWQAGRQGDTGVIIDLWDENKLRELLLRPEAANVRRHYYNPYRNDGQTDSPRETQVFHLDRASGVQFGSGSVQIINNFNLTPDLRPSNQAEVVDRASGAAPVLPIPSVIPVSVDAGDVDEGAWRGGSEVWVGDRKYLLHDNLLAEHTDPGHVVLQREALARQLDPVPTVGGGYVWLRQAGPAHGEGNAQVKAAREALVRERALLEQATDVKGVPRVAQLVTEAGHTTLAVGWPTTKQREPCQTLRASFPPNEPLDPWHLHRLLTGIRGIAATLSKLHARTVTHRYLTPNSIIVTRDGGFALRDLGLAGHPIPRPGEGPADYQAPEQQPGGGPQTPGPTTDVWQLAAVTYHLVTGRLPALRQPVPARALNHNLPEAVSDLLAAALESSPAKRPRMSQFKP